MEELWTREKNLFATSRLGIKYYRSVLKLRAEDVAQWWKIWLAYVRSWIQSQVLISTVTRLI